MGLFETVKSLGSSLYSKTAKKPVKYTLKGLQLYDERVVQPSQFIHKLILEHPGAFFNREDNAATIRKKGMQASFTSPYSFWQKAFSGDKKQREAIEKDLSGMNPTVRLASSLAADPTTYLFGIGAITKAAKAPTLGKALTTLLKSPDITSLGGILGGSAVGDAVGGPKGQLIGSFAGAFALPLAAGRVAGRGVPRTSNARSISVTEKARAKGYTITDGINKDFSDLGEAYYLTEDGRYISNPHGGSDELTRSHAGMAQDLGFEDMTGAVEQGGLIRVSVMNLPDTGFNVVLEGSLDSPAMGQALRDLPPNAQVTIGDSRGAEIYYGRAKELIKRDIGATEVDPSRASLIEDSVSRDVEIAQGMSRTASENGLVIRRSLSFQTGDTAQEGAIWLLPDGSYVSGEGGFLPHEDILESLGAFDPGSELDILDEIREFGDNIDLDEMDMFFLKGRGVRISTFDNKGKKSIFLTGNVQKNDQLMIRAVQGMPDDVKVTVFAFDGGKIASGTAAQLKKRRSFAGKSKVADVRDNPLMSLVDPNLAGSAATGGRVSARIGEARRNSATAQASGLNVRNKPEFTGANFTEGSLWLLPDGAYVSGKNNEVHAHVLQQMGIKGLDDFSEGDEFRAISDIFINKGQGVRIGTFIERTKGQTTAFIVGNPDLTDQLMLKAVRDLPGNTEVRVFNHFEGELASGLASEVGKRESLVARSAVADFRSTPGLGVVDNQMSLVEPGDTFGHLPGEKDLPTEIGLADAGGPGRQPNAVQMETGNSGSHLPPEVVEKLVPEGTPWKVPDYKELTDAVLAGANKGVLNFWTKIASLPGMRGITSAINRRGLAEVDPVAMADLRTSIYIENGTASGGLAINRARGTWADAFGFNGQGRAAKVKWAGKSGETVPDEVAHTLGDMIEHPDDYAFNAEQTAALTEIGNITDAIVEAELKAGVPLHMIAIGESGDVAGYLNRIVLRGPKGEKAVANIPHVKRMLGAKQSHTRGRIFGDIRAGVKAGLVYETDPALLLRARVNAGIRSIANQTAINDLAKFAEKSSDRIPQILKDTFALDTAKVRAVLDQWKPGKKISIKKALDSGFQGPVGGVIEEEFKLARRNLIQSKRALQVSTSASKTARLGEVPGPGNRIFSGELADSINNFMNPAHPQGLSETVLMPVTQLLRAIKTTGDFSATMVQGGILLFRNPVAWVKATTMGMSGMVSDPFSYIARNYDVMDEGMRLGAIGRPSEFLFAERGLASMPIRIPIVGDFLLRFNRSFENFVLVGQTEMWKAVRGNAKNTAELSALASSVRKQLGTLSDSALGLSSSQKAVESLALFAPRFFRAQLGLIGDLAQPGVRQREAVKAIGSMMGGAMAATIGLNMALNNGKMPNLTEPSKSDWLSINTPKGRFNLFGPMFPYMKAAARTGGDVKRAVERGDISEIDTVTIPGLGVPVPKHMVNFMNSKAGIPFKLMLDMVAVSNGESTDAFGNALPTDPRSRAEFLVRQFTPIGLDQAIAGNAIGQNEAFGELFGLRTSPKLAPDFLNEARKEKAQDLGYNRWEDIPKVNRAELIRGDTELVELERKNDEFWDKRGPKDRIDIAFDEVEKSRSGVEAILGPQWEAVQAGQMSKSEWRGTFRDLMDQHQYLSSQLLENVDLDKAENDPKIAPDFFARQYQAITPDLYDGFAEGDEPDGVISEAEWDEWSRNREAFWVVNPKAEEYKDYITIEYPTRNWKTQEVAEAHKEYRTAIAQYDQFLKIPKYKGLPLESGKFIDEVLGVARKASNDIKVLAAKQGIPPDKVKVPKQLKWAMALQLLQERDMSPQELQLVKLAIALDSTPGAARKLLSTERIQFLSKNSLIIEWYPGSIETAGLKESEAALLGLIDAPQNSAVSAVSDLTRVG